MTGADAGRVRIAVTLDGARVASVQVASDRPAAARVFVGQPPERVAAVLPLLFSLCGRAQGAAARAALAAARGAPPPPAMEEDVAREAMAEHLWRLLMDEHDPEARRACVEGRQKLADRPAFAAWLKEMTGRSVPEIEGLADPRRAAEWLAGGSPLARRAAALTPAPGLQEPVPQLPVTVGAASLELAPALDAAFARQPEWRGRPAQTGPLARHPAFSGAAWAGQAFLARWMARLLELAGFAAGRGGAAGQPGCVAAVAVAPGRGRATVETARGLLMHEATLREGLVRDYVIVAPTEWNFHPEGALKAWLTGRAAADDAAFRAFVGDAVAALDPCVEWELLVA
ncbi:MAG: hypothetical protein JNK22_03335 [Rhodocyclaceae bacterium]|nr:hypothetical protein [Rhodocyclaceae bacterium]